MKTRKIIGVTVAATLAAAIAATVAVGLSVAQTTPPAGYLGDTTLDTITLIGPPPAPGSAGAEADQSIYRATRAMKGSARWALAEADFDPRRVPANFSCAVGVSLDPATVPKTMALISRLMPDLRAAVYGPKKAYGRPRPFVTEPGETCGVLPASENNFDYPSGHAALGWQLGLVLAEMRPDRADAILLRGRAVGDGRAICGVHNYSSVIAGQTIGAAVVAAEHGSPAFRADLDAARVELEAAIRAHPLTEGCDAEAKVLATPAWQGREDK